MHEEPNLGECPICRQAVVVLMKDPRGKIVAICDECESFWTSFDEFKNLSAPPIAPPEPLSKIGIGDAAATEWWEGVANRETLPPDEDSIM